MASEHAKKLIEHIEKHPKLKEHEEGSKKIVEMAKKQGKYTKGFGKGLFHMLAASASKHHHKHGGGKLADGATLDEVADHFEKKHNK